MIHIVTYDLRKPNDTPTDYDRVMATIKTSFGGWAHIERSVWLVSTPKNATQVRDEIKAALRPGDVLFVGRLQGDWASLYLGDQRNGWLRNVKF